MTLKDGQRRLYMYEGIMVLMDNLQPTINGYYINGGTYIRLLYCRNINRTDYCC